MEPKRRLSPQSKLEHRRSDERRVSASTTGACLPFGVSFSTTLLTAALVAATDLRTAVEPAAVTAEYIRGESALSEAAGSRGERPHERLRLLLLQAGRRPISVKAHAPLLSAPPKPQASAVVSAVVAAELARARLLDEAASDAEGDAAQRCVALLEGLPLACLRRSATCLITAHSDGGTGHSRAAEGDRPAKQQPRDAGMSRAEERALFAAIVCVGRWGQTKQALIDARAARAAAQSAVDSARAEAEQVVERLQEAVGLAAAAAVAAAKAAARAGGPAEGTGPSDGRGAAPRGVDAAEPAERADGDDEQRVQNGVGHPFAALVAGGGL